MSRSTGQPIGSARFRSARSTTSSIADHLLFGVGGLFAVNFVPDALEPLYGGDNPIGAMGFVRLKLD